MAVEAGELLPRYLRLAFVSGDRVPSRAGRVVTVALVSGALAVKPGNSGNAWSRLSWTEGLRRLGVEVRFIEQIEAPSAEQLEWFRDLTERFGLAGSAWLVSADGTVLHGSGRDELLDAAAAADVLLNLGGHLSVRELFEGPRRRVYRKIDILARSC